jgi:hypothetical protein
MKSPAWVQGNGDRFSMLAHKIQQREEIPILVEGEFENISPAGFLVEDEWIVEDPKKAVYLFKKGLKIKIIDSNEKSYPLSKIAKTEWLGGYQGKQKPDHVERQVAAALQAKFKKIKKNSNSFQLRVGSFLIEDASWIAIDEITGSPKADFAILNSKGQEVFWISYKSGGGSAALQNYSGLSPRSDLIDHPEVEEFFKAVASHIERDTGGCAAKSGMSFWRPLSCSLLLSRAIWGPDYRSPRARAGKALYGRQAVQIVAQGAPSVKRQKDGSYRLSFVEGIWESGDTTSIFGDYRPVLGATYRSETCRGFDIFDKRFTNIRTGIYPKKYVLSRNSIQV